MSTQQETYADKIAKLLRKAESTTPEEAELLYQKAQELMAKYAIDEAMIAAAGGRGMGDNPIVEEEFVIVGIYRFPLTRLAVHVLEASGLHVYQLGGKHHRTIEGRLYKETVILVGVGYKNDIDRVRVLQTSLTLQAMRAENHWWAENQGRYAHDTKKQQHYQRRQFLFSFTSGVKYKLNAANVRARNAADKEHGASSVALVLRSKELMLREEFERRHPNLVKSRTSYQGGSMDARESGFTAGQQADVGQPGVGSTHREITS